MRRLALLLCNTRRVVSSFEEKLVGQRDLHAFEPDLPKDPAGFDLIIKKLKDLAPVSTNCFHKFILLVCATIHLDAHSFDYMLYILQSIGLIIKFFAHGTGKPQLGLCSTITPICSTHSPHHISYPLPSTLPSHTTSPHSHHHPSFYL